jgi:hypothetical protein
VPDLNFAVTGAEPVPFAATPQLAFRLHLSQAGSQAPPIQTIALRCQIRIEPTQRRYGGQEPQKLRDLFAEPARWGQTLRSMLWTHAGVIVPPFDRDTTVDLPVSCTFDFNVAATKYFSALEAGEVPLCFLFSGTIFYQAEDGSLQVAPIPWEKEAAFRLPVQTWREMMDRYYPNSAWLCLRKDVFDQLYDYKSRHSLPTFEQALARLLSAAEHGTP